MSKYQQARNTRRSSRTLVGRFRPGKLNPVLAEAVRPSEGGMISQTVTLELDPIAGRMITPIYGELISVFAPVQAIHALANPSDAYAGLAEVIREELLSGAPLFGLETEGEISKRLGVNPRSIGGIKKVNVMGRLAHNCAVNYLRQRKYVKATLLDSTATTVTPAIISQTVLERMNGVLDPDDRVNGMVQLDLPDVQLPIPNITQTSNFIASGDSWVSGSAQNLMVDASGNAIKFKRKDGNPAGAELDLYAELNGVAAGGVSLSDFYNAEKMDRLTREMRRIIDANPEYGEEMVERWAHGLSVDTGKVPFIIAERRGVFGRSIKTAMDQTGIEDDTMRSDMVMSLSFSVPVPKTELGGIVITFATVKPDETISSQPHPILSDVWGLDNFVADEMAIDPVPMTLRELDSDIASADESTIALYIGKNAEKQAYISYGLNRVVDPDTVENKTRIWQLEVPLSVTPDNILYPAVLETYPFAMNGPDDEQVSYTISSQCVLQTPMIFGPTPVEELPELVDDIFPGDQE